MTKLLTRAAPRRIVDDRGDVALGVFSGPVEQINHRDYHLVDPFGRVIKGLRKYLAFNQFQFCGVLSPELVLGCAIVDIKLVGTAFIYAFEPPTGRFRHFTFRTPLAIGTRLGRAPERGVSTFRAGRNRFEMRADPDLRTRTLTVDLQGGVRVSAVFDEAGPPAHRPMFICTQAGPSGWVYTRKIAGVPVRGSVRWEGRDYDLERLGACGAIDWSAGYMRRDTFWQWACLAGRLADGRLVGLNAACGVNETSFTENCFWIGGQPQKLDMVHFEHDRRDLHRPWRIRSYDGALDLEFVAEGEHNERVNAIVLASSFTQLFGRFHGTMRARDGEEVRVDGLHGFVEKHFARW